MVQQAAVEARVAAPFWSAPGIIANGFPTKYPPVASGDIIDLRTVILGTAASPGKPSGIATQMGLV
jgi:hypothetical protein